MPPNTNETPKPERIFYFIHCKIIRRSPFSAEPCFARIRSGNEPDNRGRFLIGAGLFGGFAHIAMTLAFRYAEATLLAPFEYVALLWPLIADLLIFRLPLSTSFLFALPLVLPGAAVAATERSTK